MVRRYAISSFKARAINLAIAPSRIFAARESRHDVSPACLRLTVIQSVFQVVFTHDNILGPRARAAPSP